LKQSPKELAICTTNPSLYNDTNPSQTCDGFGKRCFVPLVVMTQVRTESRIQETVIRML
jgi:hypothetical protein